MCEWLPHEPQNAQHRERGIASFSDEECWNYFRFRKSDLPELFRLLQVPAVMKIIGNHGGYVTGEYATLYMMYRLHYPCKLISSSQSWGRDYSSLSRVFNTALSYHHDLHARKVLANISWYSDRFDMYHASIQRKILSCSLNPYEGFVPANLNNIFGFLDCTANAICKPLGNNNLQNAFYNGYHHGHFIIWQGVSFPDGMIVIEGPEPGHFTDIMVWRDSLIRQSIDYEMDIRVASGKSRLKLYADKIYNVCPIVTPAWSRRQGAVHDWMTLENSIMSRIRVAVEWTFGTIIMLYKFIDFSKGQKIMNNPLEKQYVIACMLSNCHTCNYGDQHTEYFDVYAPSLDDYLSQ